MTVTHYVCREYQKRYKKWVPRCPKGSIAFPKNEMCDNSNDCEDGADEEPGYCEKQ